MKHARECHDCYINRKYMYVMEKTARIKLNKSNTMWDNGEELGGSTH